jgi:hypothetical protein
MIVRQRLQPLARLQSEDLILRSLRDPVAHANFAPRRGKVRLV